jgi:hypothetical protein
MASVLMVSGYNNGSSTTNSSLWYMFPFSNSGSYVNNHTSESDCAAPMRAPGVFSNLDINLSGNTRIGAGTLNFRKNAANGNQTVSITASTTGQFSDSTHTDTVASGNKIDYMFTPGGASGATAIFGYSNLFAATSNTVNKYLNTLASSLTVNEFIPFSGNSFSTTESLCQVNMQSAGTLNNGVGVVHTNLSTSATSLVSRINGANGNLNVSITASTTGIFEDLVNSDSISAGNLVCLEFVAGSAGVTFFSLGAEYVTTNGSFQFVAPNATASANLNYGTGLSAYATVGGLTWNNFQVTSEPPAQLAAEDSYVLSDFWIHVTTNTSGTGSYVFTSRINAANGNQSISVLHGTTGQFQDSVNTDSVTAATNLNVLVVLSTISMTVVAHSLLATHSAPPPTVTSGSTLMSMGVG